MRGLPNVASDTLPGRSPGSTRLLVALLALVAGLLGAAPASAGNIPVSKRSAVGSDFYMWNARGSGTSLPAIPFFHYELVRNLYLDIQQGVAMHVEPGRFGLGNPTGGVHYADTVLRGRLTWFAGGRLSLPLASVDSRDWQTSNLQALRAMAYYDSFLWMPNYLPASGMFGVEVHPIPILWFRATIDPIFHIPVARARDFEAILQNRFEVEFQSRAGVGGGIAIQAVVYGRGPRLGDGTQFAAEPYFVFDNDDIFLRAGLLAALDRPLGFGPERGNVLSTHFQFGVHLD